MVDVYRTRSSLERESWTLQRLNSAGELEEESDNSCSSSDEFSSMSDSNGPLSPIEDDLFLEYLFSQGLADTSVSNTIRDAVFNARIDNKPDFADSVIDGILYSGPGYYNQAPQHQQTPVYPPDPLLHHSYNLAEPSKTIFDEYLKPTLTNSLNKDLLSGYPHTPWQQCHGSFVTSANQSHQGKPLGMTMTSPSPASMVPPPPSVTTELAVKETVVHVKRSVDNETHPLQTLSGQRMALLPASGVRITHIPANKPSKRHTRLRHT